MATVIDPAKSRRRFLDVDAFEASIRWYFIWITNRQLPMIFLERFFWCCEQLSTKRTTIQMVHPSVGMVTKVELNPSPGHRWPDVLQCCDVKGSFPISIVVLRNEIRTVCEMVLYAERLHPSIEAPIFAPRHIRIGTDSSYDKKYRIRCGFARDHLPRANTHTISHFQSWTLHWPRFWLWGRITKSASDSSMVHTRMVIKKHLKHKILDWILMYLNQYSWIIERKNKNLLLLKKLFRWRQKLLEIDQPQGILKIKKAISIGWEQKMISKKMLKLGAVIL